MSETGIKLFQTCAFSLTIDTAELREWIKTVDKAVNWAEVRIEVDRRVAEMTLDEFMYRIYQQDGKRNES